MAEDPYFRAFLERLHQLGYREGTNLAVARYSGEGRTECLAVLAREVVGSGPDATFAPSSRMVRHFKQATTTIPVVGSTSDPIAQGLVASLAHPGSNITCVVVDAGIAMGEDKRLEVVREAVPGASRVGFLAPRAVWENPDGAALREIAQQGGIQLVAALLESPIEDSEYRCVFATMAQERVDAVVVSDTPENGAHRRIIIELAGQNWLPAVYPTSESAKDGGLISWGVDFENLFRHAADTVGQILQGARPGDIPFYQADTFELIVNLRTAKAHGITVAAGAGQRSKVIE